MLLNDNYRKIVTQKLPLIDLRTPKEYKKGSFLNSINLYLMDDKEREKVGIEYKLKGEEAAKRLGYSLVSGKIKEERVKKWGEFLKSYPNANIFCWRGGLRSKIVQEWIYDAFKIDVPRIKGGYKAFRNYLLLESANIASKKDFIILGGRTGSNKTILLREFNNSLDLEKLANHRGSAFGGNITPQPTQINFENNLYYDLINLDEQNINKILIEDESQNIGKRHIPHFIFNNFKRAKIILLYLPFEKRVENIFNEYVIKAQLIYQDSDISWIDTIRANLLKIKKRLGLERFNKIKASIEAAWRHQLRFSDLSYHKEWIKLLLKWYYDPLYDFQIQKRDERVEFIGSFEEVREYLKDRLK